MTRYTMNKQRAEHWNDDCMCPIIVRKLSNNNTEGRGCVVYGSEQQREYEVEDGKAHYPVSLTNRTCVC